MTRRRFLLSSASAGAAGAVTAAAVTAGGAMGSFLTGCAQGDEPQPLAPGASGSGWEFIDDRGIAISRPTRPRRVVAYISTAAGLWDFGVKPVAVFGPQVTPTGATEIQAGNVDLAAVDSVGEAWDDLDLVKLERLNPELLVTGLFGPNQTDLWAIPKERASDLEQIAPILALSEYKVVLPRVIERYGQLAAALGANLRTSKIIAAHDEFQRASDELRRSAREKPGLAVLVISASEEVVYVARSQVFGDLAYYRELGLDLVGDGGTDGFWEKLTWDEIGKYPADLIFTDTRSYAMPRHEMEAHPQWRALPAVQAGQVGDWSAEPWFNYTLAAPIIRSIAAVVQAARTDITG
jgi:iron complex transport system substrate-binding protein